MANFPQEATGGGMQLRPVALLSMLMAAVLGLAGCQEQGNKTSQSLFWQQMGQFPQGTQAWFQADLQDPVARNLLNQNNRLPDSTRQVARLLRELGSQRHSAALCQPLWTSGVYHDATTNATLALGQCPAAEESPALTRWLKGQGFRKPSDKMTTAGLVQSIWLQPEQHLWWVQKGTQTWLLTSQHSLDQMLSPATPKVETLSWYPQVVNHPVVAGFGHERGFARVALLSKAELTFLPPTVQALAGRTGLWDQFPVILATAQGRQTQKRLHEVTGTVWIPKLISTPALSPQQDADLLALFKSTESRQALRLQSRDLAGVSLGGGDRWLRYLLTYGPQGFEKQGLAIADQVGRLHGVNLLRDVPGLLAGQTRFFWQLPPEATGWKQGSPRVLLDNSPEKTTTLTQLNQLASTIPQKLVVTSPLTDRHEGNGWLWQIHWPGRVPVQVAVVPEGKDIRIGPLSQMTQNGESHPGPMAEILTRKKNVPDTAWLNFQLRQPRKSQVMLPGSLQRLDQLDFWLDWDQDRLTHQGDYHMSLTNSPTKKQQT